MTVTTDSGLTVEIRWCPSVEDREPYLDALEDVVELCAEDFVPYDGFGSDNDVGVEWSFFDNYLQDSEDVLIAVVDGRIVGLLSFEPFSTRSDVPVSEDSFGFLSLVMVCEPFRDRGIGRCLLETGLQLLSDEYGQSVVFLSTWEGNSRQFHLLCDEYGFEEVARKEGHRVNGEDTVYLGLSLEEDCDADDEEGE